MTRTRLVMLALLAIGCASEDEGPYPVLCDQYCENATQFEYVDLVTVEAFSREEAAQTCIAQSWTCSISGAVRSCDCDGDNMLGRRAP